MGRGRGGRAAAECWPAQVADWLETCWCKLTTLYCSQAMLLLTTALPRPPPQPAPAVGSWARIDNKAVIGEDVFIKVGGWVSGWVGGWRRVSVLWLVSSATSRPPRRLLRFVPTFRCPLCRVPALVLPVCCPQDEVFLNGSIVLPHKDIKESIMEPGTIIM